MIAKLERKQINAQKRSRDKTFEMRGFNKQRID